MNKKIVFLFFAIVFAFNTNAQQRDGYVQQGEFGITAGAAHYFGDLNTRSAINRPKPALGLYFRKPFNNYLAMRISMHYAQLGYSDTYSKNEYQKRRNLSFNTDIWEIAVHGDFNFYKYIPGDPDYSFTPYVTFGLGIFTYNPYAYLDGAKVYLRPLGTEGQNKNYLNRKPYGSMSVCIPIGGGIKYNVNDNLNLSVQIAQRLTFTDYLDDVSTTYAGVTNFIPGTTAYLMQDRSYETGTPIGAKGDRQRGWSKQKDQYIIAEIGISFNISSYRCPTTY